MSQKSFKSRSRRSGCENQSKEGELTFNNIGVPGPSVILAIALIVCGPARLPLLGRAFGDMLRECRSSAKGIVEERADEEPARIEELNGR